MSKESIRTAIIVSSVIGVLAILALTCLYWSRRIKRSAKAGMRIENSSLAVSGAVDKHLEVGVIQEPLPVYKKEPMKDERRLDIA